MDYTGRIITKNPQTPSANGAPGIWTLDEALQYSKQGKWPPGYQISRSVRFRSSASAYFNRTPASASNRRTWTWSGWVKRGIITGDYPPLFNAGQSAPDTVLRFSNSDTLDAILENGGSTTINTTQVFRDPSAWYHIVWAVDTTQATADNRQRLYVNGTEITAFSARTNPSQNFDTNVNNTVQHRIGAQRYASYFDGYMTEVNFIDGQQLTPASFGYFDTYTGVWQPAPYTGTYGTNGFYLTFADNSAATATTIGKDYSGNGNNWTPNNISVTAGTTYDSMVDVPINWGTDTGAGGVVRGDYAVLNPLVAATGLTYSEANLKGSNNTSFNSCTSTIAVSENSGKFYWEVISTTSAGSSPCYGFHGVMKLSKAGKDPATAGNAAYVYYGNSGNYWADGSASAYGATYAVNDVIGIALDASSSPATITFYKNNSSQGLKTLPSLTNDAWVACCNDQAGSSPVYVVNFGQRPFAYTAPSGYKALCTQNLSVPTILNGANYMAATLYTGNGGTQSITNTVNNISFAPDFVWVKSRSNVQIHGQYDRLRYSGSSYYYLASDTTNAELTGNFSALNSDGWTFNGATHNTSGATYVGWQWKGGGAGVSNTAGSITSTVSANTTAGFSVVTYTGNGTSGATIGHGLGVAPSMIIVKKRSNAGSWKVYHTILGNTKILELNATDAAQTSSTYWNNTSPASTVFTVGTNGDINTSAETYVAYCWTAITGYSAFTTYTGNGSGDGPFVYCGFRPRYLVIKRYDAAGDPWWAVDSTRSPYNQTTLALRPNGANAEDNGGNANFDFLANGFKARTSGGGNGNESGATYIVAAFAENPFTIARAR